MATRLAHLSVSRHALYSRRMVRLGFKQGCATLSSLLHQRAYQRNYRRLHQAAHKKADKKYDKKANHAFPGSAKLSRALYQQQSKAKKLKQRKADANAAYKTMLKLLKLRRNIHNRRYDIENLHTNPSRSLHSPLL